MSTLRSFNIFYLPKPLERAQATRKGDEKGQRQ